MSDTSSAPSSPSLTHVAEPTVVEDEKLIDSRSEPENEQRRESSTSKQTIAQTSASTDAHTSAREDLLDSSSPSSPSLDGPAGNPHNANADATNGKPSLDESSGQTETEQAIHTVALPNAHVQGDWQAIWSAPHGMYYFHNMRTRETTWTNPLSSEQTTESGAPSSSASQRYDLEAAALAQGIDPALAHLDPSLLAGPSNPMAFTYTAKFNARTGAFSRSDAHNPDHVSEYERMRRMSGFYFDVDEWQAEVEKRHAEEMESGKKRKKPTKKDIEMYQERKRQKKLAKTAWLRT